jgi:hypothetical protein
MSSRAEKSLVLFRKSCKPWINWLQRRQYIFKVLVSAPGTKDSGCFHRYCLHFCASPSCLQMNVHCTVCGTYISILLGGWVFVEVRIVQSYVMYWDWSKSTLVLKLFSQLIVLYCIVRLWRSKTVWNMTKKCCMDLETWPTTNLPIYIKVTTPRTQQTKEGPPQNPKNATDIHLYSLTLKGSWPKL